MNRAITVKKPEGVVPWRAYPSPETTVAELERAINDLDLELVNDGETLEIYLTQGRRRTPPAIEDLARVMFGDQSDEATLVEETQPNKIIDGDIPVG